MAFSGLMVSVLFVGFCAGAMLAGQSQAALEAAPKSPPCAGMRATVPTIRGPIAALDLISSPATMQVSERGRVQMIRFDPDDVRILQRGKTVSLDALRAGQFVEVRQAAWGGREVTQSIEILRPGTLPQETGGTTNGLDRGQGQVESSQGRGQERTEP